MLPDILVEKHGYKLRKMMVLSSCAMYEFNGVVAMVNPKDIQYSEETEQYFTSVDILDAKQVQKINGALLSMNRNFNTDKKTAGIIKQEIKSKPRKKRKSSTGSKSGLSRADRLRKVLSK